MHKGLMHKSTEIDDEFLSFISTRDLNSQPSEI
jgi:hypothetical protein